MAMKIEVLEGRKKGSNPGRKCKFPDLKGIGECYLKYCPGSRLPKEISLNAYNQPFYEGITNHLCRELKVSVPRTFVLRDGQRRRVEFVGSSFNGGREYFVSELDQRLEGDVKKYRDLVIHLLNQDRPYLELLGVEDVLGTRENIGRRDNYHFFKYPGGENTGGEITYVDLGCSLGIRAKEGRIEVREGGIQESKNMRRIRKRLGSWHVVSRDDEKIIPLEKVVDDFENIPVATINPCGIYPISEQLSSAEIDQLRDSITVIMYDWVRNNKYNDVLIRE